VRGGADEKKGCRKSAQTGRSWEAVPDYTWRTAKRRFCYEGGPVKFGLDQYPKDCLVGCSSAVLAAHQD
jgi:hypothetical protein